MIEPYSIEWRAYLLSRSIKNNTGHHIPICLLHGIQIAWGLPPRTIIEYARPKKTKWQLRNRPKHKLHTGGK